MDIDKQDDILVDYDDGDAPMRNDADVILVDEADAEMVDDAEAVKLGMCEVLSASGSLLICYLCAVDDDTPMVDDAADVVPITVEEVVVEETEIDMQPAEEDQEGDNDGDTPMREDEDDPVVRFMDEELGVSPAVETTSNIAQPSEETVSMSSTNANWPPQPTDVPAVPSLLPSALAVPQDITHQEGKIHDATLRSATADPSDSQQGRTVDPEAASIIAEAESPATLHPTILAETQTREAEQRDRDAAAETQSNLVEPAGSVRESDFGTGMTGTAPNSVAGDATEERANTLTTPMAGVGDDGRDGKWPPAPTEVPAVPSLLPSALAVPNVVAPDADGGVDAQIPTGDMANMEKNGAGREESASVVAEPAGSVRAGEGEGSVRADEGLVQSGTAEHEDDVASPASVLDAAQSTAGTQQQHADLPPIVIVIDSTRHQPLFSPLPAGVEYPFPVPASESGDQQRREWDTSSPILPDLQAELADAPMSELFMALRVSLGEDFAEERGKELVIYQEELGLKVGEDNKHAEQVTLNDIIRLHTGCGCPQPVVFHLEHDSQRFIARYEAIRKILADAREDGEEEEDEVADDDEGETVYIDAYDEEGEDDESAYEDYEQHHEEAEEDELAQDATTEEPVDTSKLNGGVQVVREVTEEILEYEEDEGTISASHDSSGETTVTAPKAADTDTDQFGVDAAIRVAEEAAGAAGLSDTAHQEHVTSASTSSIAVTGITSSAKRPLEEGGSAQGGNVEGERQVKRKLSVDAEGEDGEA
ncbi:hypothetical protein QFC19_001456 [Naganishia cerealis]|uniref:Uncharacterized protein n=1 Tax=Naganishia cerealis TaxID=610337 RepID=A0ACC2WJ94_9TREE|nr:hypothetical protein QFC19_001456 [Naganishia cerealis]